MNEELKVVITAATEDFKQGIAEVRNGINDMVSESKGQFSSFSDNVSKAGEISNNILKGTATAITGAGAALMALVPATEEYRIAQSKLNTAFETVGSSAETASQVYNDLYRVLGDGDVAVEAAGHLAQLTTNEKDLAEWTEVCQGVYATFGESIPIESLTEASNETAKTGELTGALTDALVWAGQSEEDFKTKLEACNSEAEREALIRETLSGLYSEAAATYEENAAGILANNEAQAKMAESTAAIGEALTPVMAMLTELGAEVLSEIAPYIEEFVAENGPAIKEALTELAEKIGNVISFIADNWEIITTIGGIILGVVAAISALSAGLTAYSTVMGIASAVSLPMIGTIAAIVAGIAALSAIIILVVKNWDEIKEAAGKAVEAIKEGVTNMASKVSEKWEDIKESASKTWENIKSKASEKWENIKSTVSEKAESIKTNVTDKFETVKSNISDKLESAKKNVSEKFSNIKETMSEKMSEAKEKVTTHLGNMKKAYEENGGGMKGIAAATMEHVKGTFSGAYNKLNEMTGGKLGEIVDKFKNKFEAAKQTAIDKFENIKSGITDKIEAAKDKVSGAINKIKGFFDFEFKWPKIPMPHFGISPQGWKIGDLLKGSIPKLSIDWYAQGGIFNKPTLFGYGGALGGLGEQGAEAIVPLEKNTQWMDRIAERLAAKMGSAPTVLMVDGKVFAETAISTINSNTRQTGKLGLVVY